MAFICITRHVQPEIHQHTFLIINFNQCSQTFCNKHKAGPAMCLVSHLSTSDRPALWRRFSPSETGQTLTSWRFIGNVVIPLSDEPPRIRPAYFLLAARGDCLWKINQRFDAALCFILAVTHHINKPKLLDAPPVFWHVPFAGEEMVASS